LLERAEKDILIDEYNALDLESNGGTAAMSEEDLDLFIEELKKRPEILGSVSNIGIARQLISSLASRLATSQQASGFTS
jgi:hypothetical protein